jgi:hypothetical protein
MHYSEDGGGGERIRRSKLRLPTEPAYLAGLESTRPTAFLYLFRSLESTQIHG